jgi:cysteinyl-tRNA synthetase
LRFAVSEDVYFSVGNFPEYVKLSGRKLNDIIELEKGLTREGKPQLILLYGR